MSLGGYWKGVGRGNEKLESWIGGGIIREGWTKVEMKLEMEDVALRDEQPLPTQYRDVFDNHYNRLTIFLDVFQSLQSIPTALSPIETLPHDPKSPAHHSSIASSAVLPVPLFSTFWPALITPSPFPVASAANPIG